VRTLSIENNSRVLFPGLPSASWAICIYMKNRNPLVHPGDATVLPATPITVVERRSAARQHFIAEAQIVEVSSGAKLSARSCDLTVDGCYVDSLNTFAIGTLVRIRLKREKTIVEANGAVVNRVPGLGMGIAFRNLTPETREALKQWLSQMPPERDLFAQSAAPAKLDQPAARLQPAEQVVDLIQMLAKKGILNRGEVAALLKVPFDE
jgi:hypothetical protein